MAKVVLSSLLILTQLVCPAGASPVYLCLCESGSTCIDFGPSGCGCCREAAGDHEACGDHHEACGEWEACHHGESAACLGLGDETDTAGAFVRIDDCDCDHIEISQSQCSALDHESAAVARAKAVAGAWLADRNFTAAQPAVTWLAQLPARSSPPPGVAASAVMRC